MPSMPDLIDQDRAISDAESDRRKEQFRKSQELIDRATARHHAELSALRNDHFKAKYGPKWRERMAAAQEKDQAAPSAA